MDGDLGLELGDPPTRCGQLGVLAVGRTRKLPGVDQLLVAPDIDRLFADVEIGGDLRDPTVGGEQIEDLAAELGWIPLGTELVILSTGRTVIIQ